MGDTEVLTSFFRTIWHEDTKGYIYLALKDPSTTAWTQKFFEWPLEERLVVQEVINQRASKEVYFAPSIFQERSALKEHVLGSFCFWLEFDGALPVDYGETPSPTMIVQTSTPTHQHIYWAVDQLQGVDQIEKVNRSLAYSLGADVSGWDANQVLRPPQTLNHKKELQAKLVLATDNILNSVAFSTKTIVNLPPKLEFKGVIPPVTDFAFKYSFPREVWDLYTIGATVDRSAGEMCLGYYLAEMNLTNLEIMSMLVDADTRWGKFSKRNDQISRLTEIVTRARIKFPYRTQVNTQETTIITVGDTELQAIETKVDWLWEGIIHQEGYLLMTGHTGVGKTSVCLDYATHLALGIDYLGRKVTTSKKVLFISLEMGHLELKLMRALQLKGYTESQKKELSEKLRFWILGYPVYFNRDENKILLEEYIQREGIGCVIFDSLGSMTEQELSKETDAKNLMDWNDHLRAELGISTLIIHHHRKAQTGNKRPNSISDIYGSHYFTARATTVMTLWDPKFSGLIEVSFQKMRLSKREAPYAIKRKDDLTFEISTDKVSFIEDDTTVDVTDTNVPEPHLDAFEI